jgi:hypothetical protein
MVRAIKVIKGVILGSFGLGRLYIRVITIIKVTKVMKVIKY